MTERRSLTRAFGWVAAVCAFAALPAIAQEKNDSTTPPANPPVPAVKQTTPAIDYRERPRYPYDPQRLKRRPTLDGVIADNEWDALYTIGSSAANGTIYVNWDEDYLYVAARTDQPAWLVFDLDANADGWLRGADNLELTVRPIGDDTDPQLTARVLDAAGNKDAPTWNDHVIDPRSIQIVEKAAAGGEVIEIAIPKGVVGLNPRLNATLSCRADLLPAGPAPIATQPYEPHLLLDITLVESRVVATSGVTPRLVLDDSKVIPGQTIHATLELTNQTDQSGRIRDVVWKGEAGAADLLNSLRQVNIPPLQGQKTLKVRYSSTLPETAVPGFYQITSTAEMEDGRIVSATASFSIVEAIAIQIAPETDPVTILGPTKARFNVMISSAVPGAARGNVEITAPSGWIVQGRQKKDFLIEREDTSLKTPFFITLPSNTPAGDYVVNVMATWRNKTWKAHCTLHVNRSSEPSGSPPAKPDIKPL